MYHRPSVPFFYDGSIQTPRHEEVKKIIFTSAGVSFSFFLLTFFSL